VPSLGKVILANSKRIVSEWEEFAKSCLPAAAVMDLEDRRDHVEAMLHAIARDLETPQTRREQAEKSRGEDDSEVDSDTAANAHGTDRAASGYTPIQMVAEFRALRASVLRIWTETEKELSHEGLETVTRFNEAIDQLLAESMAQYAEDVEYSKDLFLGVLGHDLRNPLSAVLMTAAQMIAHEGPDWRHLKATTRIVTSCTRMDGMICDLVDFTRARLGGGIPVDRVEMDLEPLVRETIDEITAFHPESVITLDANGQLRGQWDRGRIGQALSNLIGNAVQHGAKSRPVEVTLRGEPDRVVVILRNEGPMIAKRDLREIFSPFRRIEPTDGKSRDLRSVGLGLFIAEAIVLAHQGTIDVESTKAGTTFTVRLPR
jgi:signal transduction histidine kinase